ncbi:CPBP family intramembrane glutamic endopeptidase [Staphylococcus sp. 11261D007BR]
MTAYRWRDIAWRDLWLIPIVLVSQFVLAFIFFSISIGTTLINGGEITETSLTYGIVLTMVVSVISYLLVILSFWLLHLKTMKTRFLAGIEGIKTYWKWIVGVYIITYAVSVLYNVLKPWLPEPFQYAESENEMIINEMINNTALLPLSFAFIVILGPIVEEIFFRHILIGELGKKFNFKVMAVISVVGFAALHILGAQSPFEIIDYLILAVPIVWLYLKSGRNLGVTIAFHVLNNFISFLLTLIF